MKTIQPMNDASNNRRKIKDLTVSEAPTLAGVCFIYPGDGQAYYWASQWNLGVWGKKSRDSTQIFPLAVANDLSEALEWELAE